MTMFRLLAALAVVSLAVSADAGAAKANDGVFLYYPETGRMVMGELKGEEMAGALKHAKAVDGPVVVLSHGGKAYIVENPMQAMANGQPMVDFLDKMTYSAR